MAFKMKLGSNNLDGLYSINNKQTEAIKLGSGGLGMAGKVPDGQGSQGEARGQGGRRAGRPHGEARAGRLARQGALAGVPHPDRHRSEPHRPVPRRRNSFAF